MMKKLAAFLLAASMLLSLCACGTTVEAYEETAAAAEPAAEEVAAAETAAEETEAEAQLLDFDAAYAVYDPTTVVFTVDGENVTWQEFFYEIVYNASAIAAQEGVTVTDWDQMCSLYTDTEGNPVYTYGQVVLQYAIDILTQYHIMDKQMEELGIVLNEEYLTTLEDFRQQTIDQSFGGDEAAFIAYLEDLYCTEELWNWFNQVDLKYAQAFEDLYGEMGSEYADSDVMLYAAGDADGAWTEYVQLKMICLFTEDETTEEAAEGEEEETTSGEPTEEAALTEKELAAQIMAELTAAEDMDAKYAELYALYNEETGLDPFPDGWCLYQGDTADAIYGMALAMEPGEVRIVSIDGAEVVVWKVLVDPDAGVTYDSTTDTVYTLRYYAAWQEYGDMVNGWLDTGIATAQWAEGFEGFTLDSVFA